MVVPRGSEALQADLVEQARRGDREAFAVLAGAAVDRLYAVARLILRDADLAEDAAQETLVRAWRDLPSLRDVDRFDAWLYRLTVRSCADIGRQRRRWRTELSVVPPEPVELDRSSEIADRDELARGLRRLSEAQRSILVLTYYLGFTPSDVAEALDIPVGTAKSRLHYAIEALRAALAADARASEPRAQPPAAQGGRTA
jgi:RNA polymerase sigma-70 factor (ECF subfamily)